MTTYLALLRAVNLGPHNKIAMADLRDILTELGFQNVRSLLQTGNLLFDAQRQTRSALERTLEATAQQRLDLATDFFVRTTKEWNTAVSRNPFLKEAQDDPGHLVLFALKLAPNPESVAELRNAIPGRETIHAKGNHLYAVYPDGIGRSRLTNVLIEKHLATRATGRNWNSVLKLAALLNA
jgi:uncharacterized protein (DUF1697 family)